LRVPGSAGDVLQASVAPRGRAVTGAPNADALGVDDHAYTLLAAPREVQVLLAGPGNVFLEAALAAIQGVEVTTADEVPAADQLGDVDLIVVDRVAAPGPPSRPTLYVAPSVPPPGVDVTAERSELPAITFQSAEHELLASVELAEVAIASAQRVTAPTLQTLAGGSQVPLLLAGRLDGTPAVYLAFDLLGSNLPLQAAWPVLVANTVSWLAGAPAPQPATAGTTVTVALPTGATAATVRSPSGAAQRLDPAAPRLLVDEVGVWRVTTDPAGGQAGREAGEATAVAVNPAPSEGDLARARPGPADERASAEARRAAGVSEGRRGFGRELLALVLLLAAAEWVWAMVLRPRRARRPRRLRGEAPHRGRPRRRLPRRDREVVAARPVPRGDDHNVGAR
ncbi:MAG TPA: hypothetical protein VHF25_09060, partial [Nitriliruptorales bacterium]|nr:hypothetical protein [Nitriliruptorales bacterium]